MHAVAPRAVLGNCHVLVPVVADRTHVAELASDGLALDQRISSDDASLPLALALVAAQGSFVNSIVVALLAAAHGQLIANAAVHVDLQDPVTNLVTLVLAQEVLLGQHDVVRGWNVGVLKLRVVGDSVVVRVHNCVVKIDVPVKENVGHFVVTGFSVGLTSLVESFVGSDLFAVSQKRSA